MIAPGRSEIVLSGWPSVSERHVRTLGVSIETVVRLAGRRDVRASYVLTEDGAMFRLNWRA